MFRKEKDFINESEMASYIGTILNPEDDAFRLAFADQMLDNTYCERSQLIGEFVLQSIQGSTQEAQDLLYKLFPSRHIGKMKVVLKQDIECVLNTPASRAHHEMASQIIFNRGFVECVVCTDYEWIKLPDLLAFNPIIDLILKNRIPSGGTFRKLPGNNMLDYVDTLSRRCVWYKGLSSVSHRVSASYIHPEVFDLMIKETTQSVFTDQMTISMAIFSNQTSAFKALESASLKFKRDKYLEERSTSPSFANLN